MQHADAFAIFAKVGELESISGAARTLGLPKANVSRAVSRLESVYKVSLLDRTTRRVRLTEVGQTLHKHCLRILEEMEEAEAEVAAHRGLPAGILRIGCPADLSRHFIGDHIQEFLTRYPDIDLRIQVGERLLPEPNRLDVVLHAGWLSDSRLIVRKIVDIRTWLVASRTYVEANGLPQTIEELANHAVIGNFYLDPAAAEVGRLPAHVPLLELVRDGERFPVPIWSRFSSTDHTLMQTLVERGAAIGGVAAIRALKGLADGELVRVLPDFELFNQGSLYALYTARLAMAPKLKVFLDFVSELAARSASDVTSLYGLDPDMLTVQASPRS